MECDTIYRYDPETHEPITKPKMKFETLDDAIAYCKKFNAKSHVIHKIVSYKCKTCFKYHVGRNGKEIKEKQREKYRKQL